MNEGQLTDLVMERKDIPALAKIVLRAIIRRVDWKTWESKAGHKTVSTRELAKRCGVSQMSITRSIQRLEEAKLIERDFFKAGKSQAPPIKVNVENIINGTKAVKKTTKCGQGVTTESCQGVTTECGQEVTTECEKGDHKKLSLSIDNNKNTIINTIINTSLGATIEESFEGGESWGVPDEELWGDHLYNDLLISSHSPIYSDTDTDTDKENDQ
jgi:DNA-binding transcriptional regulator YhcF (GntR family)